MSSGHEKKAEPGEVRLLRTRNRRLAIALLVIFSLGAVTLATSDPGAELLFVLAIAPSSYILWHFHHADKYKREPVRFLLGTFAIGGALSPVAGLIESMLPRPDTNAGIVTIFLYFLFGVGLIEESTKFISVRIYSYRSSHFDEAMDGVIFGISGALGFATVENILYVFNHGVATAFIRAFISVPGHAFWGAIIGYYLGEAKVHHQPSLALQGLVIAVFLHGLFDTLAIEISDPVTGLMILGGLVWIIYFKIVKKEIAKAQSESPYLPIK